MPASTNLQRSLPSYYESFQNALDNLSEQIVSWPNVYDERLSMSSHSSSALLTMYSSSPKRSWRRTTRVLKHVRLLHS